MRKHVVAGHYGRLEVEWVLDRGTVVCGCRPICLCGFVCVVVLLQVLIPFSFLMK
jgi:hypothetical protein